MFLFFIPRNVLSPRKVYSVLLLISLLANSSFAAPEEPISLYNGLFEAKQDLSHAWASSTFGSAFLFFDSVRSWLSTIGTKRTTPDRIVIEPYKEDGGLTIMQGEKVVFSAIGYSGDDAVSGISFKWTVQDEGRTTQTRDLIAGVFEPIRSGRYIVTAIADSGQQAQINVSVYYNENYFLQKLLGKPVAERTERESQVIAALIQHGDLATREINSRGSYNAASERSLNDAFRAKREAVRERQSLMRQQHPDPILGFTGATANPTGNSSQSGLIKRPKHGPNTDDLEASEETLGGLPTAVKDPNPKLERARPVDEDGWNGTNWYTADDPVNLVGKPAGTAPDKGAGNGNFEFSAPVLSLPGRGIDVNLALTYNSRLWSKSGTEMTYDSDKGFPGPGWSLGFGKMMWMGDTGGCMMVASDGTRRSSTGTPNVLATGANSFVTYIGHTNDGSFVDFNCVHTSGTYTDGFSGTATLSNGTTVTYGSPSVTYDQTFPTQITDVQGNYINITYVNNQGPNISTITDTAGRVISFHYSVDHNLLSVTGPGYNGTTRTFVRLTYKQPTLSYAFAGGYTTDTATDTPWLVKAIYYPGTNNGYWFGDNDSYSDYGMLAKVIQSRGMSYFPGLPGAPGTIANGATTDEKVYNFTLVSDSSLTDAPTYTTCTESWAGMDTSAAVTTYGDSKTGTDEIITVTQPDLTVNKQTSFLGGTFDGFYYQGEVYASSSASTPMAKIKTFFGAGDYGSSRPTRVEVTDELGHTTATDLAYATSKYNQLITQKEYGYSGALYRQVNNTYQNSSSYTGRHVFNLPASTETVDASSNRLTRIEYEYDNNAVVTGTSNHNLAHADGVIMHKDTSDAYTSNTHHEVGACTNMQWNYPECTEEGQFVDLGEGLFGTCHGDCLEYADLVVNNYDPNSIFRGNVTKVTTYSDAASLSGANAYDFTYDITGNQVTATTNCCQEMSFDYTDSFSDTTNHHTYAYPTSHTKGSSVTSSPLRMTESAIYDLNTGVITTSIDFNGLTTRTAYDAVTRPTIVTMPTAATTTAAYDDANLTSSQVVKLSDNTTIVGNGTSVLNGRGQPVLSKYQAGATNFNASSTQYDEMGRRKEVSLPYDSAGSPSQWTEYTYDALSRLTQTTAPDGSTSKSFFDEAQRPDSASASFGQTVRSQDAWGRERWARTDDFGRLAEVVEPNPAGSATTPTINAALASNGSTATSTGTWTGHTADSAIDGRRHTGNNYNADGGWDSATGASTSNPQWLEINFGQSRNISEIDVYTLRDSQNYNTDPTQTETCSTWCIRDFKVQYWNGTGWTDVSNVTGNNKVWRQFTFTAVTTQKIRIYVTGAPAPYTNARVVEAEAWTVPVTSGATGSVFDPGSLKTSYADDELDQLKTVTQGAQTRSFKYDSLGRLTRQKLAEQTATLSDAGCYVGAGCTGPALWSDAFTYDARSNVTKRIDARGVETDFSYNISSNPDPLNRLQSISYSTTGADTTYGIIPAAAASLAYMTSGDQTRVSTVTTSGVATKTNSYDGQGRISDYTLTLDSRSSKYMTTSYDYDTANRLTKVTYPKQWGFGSENRKEVLPSYDQASRITQVNVENVGDSSSTQLSDISYNTFGQVTSLKTGLSTGNADVEQYSYDSQTGLLTNQKVYKASNMSSPLLDLTYGYSRGNSIGTASGKTGQLTRITDNHNESKDRVYEFDALGRLTKAKGGLAADPTTGVNANWTQEYTYDRYGNKTGVTVTGIDDTAASIVSDGLPSLGYNTATNRISDSGWQYDNAGNLMRGQNDSGIWQKFKYDAAGRLVEVDNDSGTAIETYKYAADRSRLIRETSSGRTYYAWGGSSVMQEYTEGTSSTTPVYSKSYTHAGSRLLSTSTVVSSAEVLEFHHPDRLGTRLVTNPSASTYYEQSTMPFGTAFPNESTGFSNQTFTTYDRSSSTGLDYAINRTHSSGQGRFTQVDPLGMAGASGSIPQSLNLYAYAQNRPTDFVDPSGLDDIPVEPGIIHVYTVDFSDFWQFLLDSLEFNNHTIFSDPGTGGGGGGGGGPSGPAPNPKDALCKSYIARATRVVAEFLAELAKYDPVADAKGGFPMKWGKKSTSQFGHWTEMKQMQRQMKDIISKYNHNCNDRNDGRGGRGGGLPQEVGDLSDAYIPRIEGPGLGFDFQLTPEQAAQLSTAAATAYAVGRYVVFVADGILWFAF
ncbi:MAG: RHS repeat-associated core domain-containing protein [Acidobacteriota bacterium]